MKKRKIEYLSLPSAIRRNSVEIPVPKDLVHDGEFSDTNEVDLET